MTVSIKVKFCELTLRGGYWLILFFKKSSCVWLKLLNRSWFPGPNVSHCKPPEEECAGFFEAEIKKTRLKLKITPKKCISHWTVSSRSDSNWLRFKRTGRAFEFSARRQYKDASVRKSFLFIFFCFYWEIFHLMLLSPYWESQKCRRHIHTEIKTHTDTHTVADWRQHKRQVSNKGIFEAPF